MHSEGERLSAAGGVDGRLPGAEGAPRPAAAPPAPVRAGAGTCERAESAQRAARGRGEWRTGRGPARRRSLPSRGLHCELRSPVHDILLVSNPRDDDAVPCNVRRGACCVFTAFAQADLERKLAASEAEKQSLTEFSAQSSLVLRESRRYCRSFKQQWHLFMAHSFYT